MDIADINRRLDNLIRLGVIDRLNYERPEFPCARVRCGNLLTNWLPLASVRAGQDGEHDPYEVGEQVIILCPCGTLEQGVIVASLFSQQRPAPSTSPTIHRRQYRDGAIIDYDTANHALTATLPAGGTVTATASGGFWLTGNVTIQGNLSTVGQMESSGAIHSQQSISADDDVKAQSVSLLHHNHTGVRSGNEISGEPVK